jgi:tetratricopeptide (TPR) repeat protein
MNTSRARAGGLACAALLATSVCAGEKPGRFTLTTRSKEAREGLAELQLRIENQQFGPANVELARKIVEMDPAFAMGHYYLSAVTFPADPRLLDKARALAASASDGERRFIEAMVLARGDKPAQAVEPLTKLARDYPSERVVHMLLGQVLAEGGRLAEARKEYSAAIALDATTPRAHAFLASLLVLEGDYPGARAAYAKVLKIMPAGTAPGPARYGIAFTYLYEGNPDAALDSLRTFVEEYKKAGAPFGIPEVFIWNSIARINLENGRLDEAMKAYEKGYESVPGSGLEPTEKTIWRGRLHHGKGRTLARMGRYDEAWKEAETIRRMIDEGGERGKEFEPAYHYLAGYIKLEKGDAEAAVDQLKKANLDDPFHKLLLARAYEKVGDKPRARKAYEEVLASTAPGLERALAYPEAKKRLAALQS